MLKGQLVGDSRALYHSFFLLFDVWSYLSFLSRVGYAIPRSLSILSRVGYAIPRS